MENFKVGILTPKIGVLADLGEQISKIFSSWGSQVGPRGVPGGHGQNKIYRFFPILTPKIGVLVDFGGQLFRNFFRIFIGRTT